jgi:hypothetical protein
VTLAGFAEMVKVAASTIVIVSVRVRANPPPVPVIVTVTGPSGAVAVAQNWRVNISGLPGTTVEVIVTPVGSPVALRVTAPVNPPLRVIVIVVEPHPPRGTVTFVGFAESEKLGAFTVSAIVAVRVIPPPVPVTMSVARPAVAVVEAARVSTVLFAVVDVGLKVPVTPAGNPATVNAMLFVNPPVRVMVIVSVPLAPRLIARLVGFAESEKSGALTVRLIVAVCESPPPVPVTVIEAGPAVAVLEAVKVNVLLVPVVEVGLKAAVTPLGNPLMVKATLGVKEFNRVTVIVLGAVAPLFTVTFCGLAESEKSGVGGGPPAGKSCD